MVPARPEPPAGGGRGPRLLLVALAVAIAGLAPGPAPATPIGHRDAAVPAAPPPDPGTGQPPDPGGAGQALDPGAGGVPALRMPVAGAVVRGFELPAGPYGPGHRGIDVAVAVGERARAPTAGRVAFAGPVAGATWVSLAVAPGVLVTLGPLLDMATATGRRAPAGAPIGRVASGHGPAPPATGVGPASGQAATLHLSVRVDGVYVDPLPYLVDRPRPRLAPLLAPGGLARP
jgi:murein DD-endopeptidase MepM/ murein hydrolase activator NlpD